MLIFSTYSLDFFHEEKIRVKVAWGGEVSFTKYCSGTTRMVEMNFIYTCWSYVVFSQKYLLSLS